MSRAIGTHKKQRSQLQLGDLQGKMEFSAQMQHLVQNHIVIIAIVFSLVAVEQWLVSILKVCFNT